MGAFVISALIALWGNIYTNEGQTAADIRKQLFEPGMTDAYFANRPTKNDTYKSVYSTTDDVLQAFSIPFTEDGNITFKPSEVKLGSFKIDKKLTPDELRNSYVGFLANIEEPERKNWPIIRWAIEQLYIPRANEQYEQEVAWYGWEITGYDATPNVTTTGWVREFTAKDVAQPANGSMDGLWIQILKNLSRVNVIATGAVGTDATAWCTKVETFCEGIDAPLRAKIDYLFMSEKNFNLYKRGRRAKYNSQYLAEADLMAIDNCNIKVAYLRSMDGSDKIWGTPASNRIKPTHTENTGRFDAQALDRSVKLLTDWKKAIGFEIPEYVVTNDLENTIPTAVLESRYGKPAA